MRQRHKRLAGVLSLVLILAVLTGGCATSKKDLFDIKTQTPKGYIHAEGKHLALDGKTVVLKGVNAGGWLLTEDWMTPTSLDGDLQSEHGQYELENALTKAYGAKKTQALLDTYRDNWWTEKDFENIANIGFNLIRLPFGWEDITDENGTLKQDAFSRLDWFAGMCEKCHLFVIFDLHGAYGSQNGRHHSGDTTTEGDLFGNGKNEQLTMDLWKAVAAHFWENPWVAGYDLLNEPEGTPDGLTGQAQWDFYNKLYEEIRKVDERMWRMSTIIITGKIPMI